MSCNETQTLIHGYLDGELDLMRSMEIERHLHDCGACSQAYRGQQALRGAFAAGALYHEAPARLHKKLRSSLRKEIRSRSDSPVGRRGLLAAASLAFAAALLIFAAVLLRPSTNDPLVQQIIAGHVRSLMANHLADVASSDQHTVKPWFTGKLDFSPPVADFAAQGFPLIGGRLDYLDDRPVAALVYRRNKHVINLFIWPSEQSGDRPTKTTTRRGYHLIQWARSGMHYAAVSDLNTVELQEFVSLVQPERVNPP